MLRNAQAGLCSSLHALVTCEIPEKSEEEVEKLVKEQEEAQKEALLSELFRCCPQHCGSFTSTVWPRHESGGSFDDCDIL